MRNIAAPIVFKFVFAASVVASLTPTAAHAHLLNMTRVDVEFRADGVATMKMEVDLSRAFADRQSYYSTSQSEAPLQDRQIAEALQPAIKSMHIVLDEQTLVWQVTHITMPQNSESEFLSPLAWPMANITFAADFPASSSTVVGYFQGDWDFEEPIALTLRNASTGKSMSRWLVARQKSPAFMLHSSTNPNLAIPEEPIPWITLVNYLKFGFLHILPGGFDHLLFVLGIFLAAVTPRKLLLFISVFTLAHTLTLVTGALGYFQVSSTFVEPLIVASIIWVGIDNLLARQRILVRTSIIFAFGLLHGMGFATAIKELGMPSVHYVTALLSFNLGVELGQLVFVAGLLLLTFRIRSSNAYRKIIVIPTSIGIIVVATLWLLRLLS